MRRGATSTSRALSEQATASEQISKEADRLAQLAGQVSRSMGEQAAATNQIGKSSEGLRVQSTQTAQALQDQSRAVRDLTAATANISKQIKLISSANLEHSALAESMLQSHEGAGLRSARNGGGKGRA